MNKKKDPRTAFIIFRVSDMERKWLVDAAIKEKIKFSTFIRMRLGLNEDNR